MILHQRSMLFCTGNTKTGASAASHLDELGEDTASALKPAASLLVGQCPAFLNELGNEEERNVVLTHLTAQRRVQQITAGELCQVVALLRVTCRREERIRY